MKQDKKGLVRLDQLPTSASELKAHRMFLEGIKKKKEKDCQDAKQRAEKSLKTMQEIIKKLNEK